MKRAQRHLAGIFIVIASFLAAAGCVSVPTSGPIEKVEGSAAPLPELRERRSGPSCRR